MCRLTAFLILLCATTAHAQPAFPLGDASLHGRVFDSVTNRTILRTSICREYQVPIYGAALRCATVDSSGRYSFDSLTAGPNTITVDCAAKHLFGGRRLAQVTVELSPGERRHLDIATSAAGCDPRPLLTLRGLFRGHYSSGFEHSQFVPCAEDGVFAQADTVGMAPHQLSAWVSWRRGAVPGNPRVWPEPKRVHPPWNYPQYYVEWFGSLVGPGHYGHLGVSGFSFVLDSIVTVRTPEQHDCAVHQRQ